MSIFLYPTEKGKMERISQQFGERPEVYAQFGLKGHNGLDFAIPNGTFVLSIGDGKVIDRGYEGPKKGYGRYLKIQHDGYQSTYAHLQECFVKTGDTVKAGQKIAASDNTGFSSGSHLHMSLKQTNAQGQVLNADNGYKGAIDPLPLLEPKLELPPMPTIESWRTDIRNFVKSLTNTSDELLKDVNGFVNKLDADKVLIALINSNPNLKQQYKQYLLYKNP